MNKKRIGVHPTGGNLLELITSGMYKSPLAVYREYLQNSLDAYDSYSRHTGDRSVWIDIDPASSSICIRDCGPGLAPEEAVRALVPIASSQKDAGANRGFRGIGRLSALAFAEEVSFRTKNSQDPAITEVTWRRPTIGDDVLGLPMDDLVERIVSIEQWDDSDDSGSFFEVNIVGVKRQVANPLLNKVAVKSYIAETGPVPFGKGFKYSSEIEVSLPETSRSMNLNVIVNNDKGVILRPHDSVVVVNSVKSSEYVGLETFCVENIAGTEFSAIGWIAHTEYLGAIMRRDIRGIRARQGNIQIGGEDVFSHLFREDRFAKWCVGEVHILGGKIRPNATRDYFETSAELKNLENHIAPIAEEISIKCRLESKKRSVKMKVQRLSKAASETMKLAEKKYLSVSDCNQMISEASESLQGGLNDYKKKFEGTILCSSTQEFIDEIEILLSKLRSFENKPGSSLVSKSKQKWFGKLAKAQGDPVATMNLIEKIINMDK